MTRVDRKSLVTWSGFATLYVALTVAYAWPLFPSISTALPHDIGDPGLNAWILWWNSQAVPLTERWWNAPMFHPVAGAFALSETLLSLSVLTTPLIFAGANAVTAYNVAYLISFPAAALAAHALAHRLTGRHDAALIAGLAFGFSPYRASQMPHIQMLWSMWMPLVLLALHRYIDRHRVRDLLLAGVFWVMNGLTSGYFLVFFAILTLFWMLWFARSLREWIGVGLTLTLASLVLAPVLLGYQRHQSALGLSRHPDEIGTFSADLSGFLAAAETVWLPSRWTVAPLPEGELYPGLTIVLLTIAGAVVASRRARLKRWNRLQIVALAGGLLIGTAAIAAPVEGWQVSLLGWEISLTRVGKALFTAACLITLAIALDHRIISGWRQRSPFIFYTAGAIVMILFALGPVGRAFGKTFLDEAPYAWLMELPGGHSLRVPARFAMMVILCLTQAAALAFSRLTPVGSHRLVVGAIGLMVLLDGWVLHFPLARVSQAAALTGNRDTRIPVAELPIQDVFTDTAAMLRATAHKHPLINGFSGYSPAHYGQLQEGVNGRDASVFDALQGFGPLIVVVDRARDPEGDLTRFVSELPGAEWLFRSPLGAAYQLPGRPVGRVEAADRLQIAYVDANENYPGLSRMLDGNILTRWETDGPQVPNREVTMVLAQPARLTRLEMDLGEWALDYPRKFRVAVADAGKPPVTVWEGGTAGAAVLGSLASRDRSPVVIDLPPEAIGRRFTLTTLAADPVYYWTIAELHAFGRVP